MAALWGNEVDRSGHERTAGEAVANLMSGGGLLYVPTEVLQMLTQAIEVGFATALKEVRDGDHDDDIRERDRTCPRIDQIGWSQLWCRP